MRAYRILFFQFLALLLYSVCLSISLSVLIPGNREAQSMFFIIGLGIMVTLLNKAK
jgi:hypothetical protein